MTLRKGRPLTKKWALRILNAELLQNIKNFLFFERREKVNSLLKSSWKVRTSSNIFSEEKGKIFKKLCTI